MATQTQLLNQTLDGIAKLRERPPDYSSASESGDGPQPPTNRGNKLKRKANLVHEGQIYPTDGPATYKRKIHHGGYEVNIISRKPLRYDEYGDLLNDDEINEAADAEAAFRDPYHGIEIDKLLRPLTSAAELPIHPSLSAPYKSAILERMIEQTSEMLYREREALWHAKGLMTDLHGDGSWLPCGLFHMEQDNSIFDTRALYATDIAQEIRRLRPASSHKKQINGTTTREAAANIVPITNGSVQKNDKVQPSTDEGAKANSDETLVRADENSRMESQHAGGDTSHQPASIRPPAQPSVLVSAMLASPMHESAAIDVGLQGSHEHAMDRPALPSPASSSERPGELRRNLEDQDMADNQNAEEPVDEDVEQGASQTVPHRMTTRAQAHAASDQNSSTRTRTPSPCDSVPLTIHPLFLVPKASRPDSDFGLGVGEAEETRYLLAVYIQKQDEVVRGVEKLFHGLLRALRLRKNVYRWCKAESHVDEMSDGEDWYDMEEWGLDEPLRKGHDDEEEDPGQSKKTRTRRAA